MKHGQLGFHDYRLRHGRGGPRAGAGRPKRRRGIVHHVARMGIAARHPMHVTLRVQEGIPSLRYPHCVGELRESLAEACDRGDFRLVHYSVQRNHLHLLVEADGNAALECGMKSISIRVARAVNRAYQRKGPVLDGRYHLRVLETPREVRDALAYVLLNARRHWKQRTGVAPPVRLDAASSAPWFEGWQRDVAPRARPASCPVATPRTWLLRSGWKLHGLIDPAEVPGG